MSVSNSIQVFNKDELGNLRTATNEKGEVWVCLSDVCSILGLSNPAEVKKRLEADGCVEINVNTLRDSYGISAGNPNLTFINEENLYSCIFRSNKPEAKKFQKWVFGEVLPCIRKTGVYAAQPAEPEDKMLIMAKAILYADEQIKQLTVENKELQDANALHKQEIAQKDAVLSRQKPKVEYYDEAMASDMFYNTNQIAMELGTSAIRLNARLLADGIQYCQNGCWVLTMKYRDKGLSVVRTWEARNNDGSVTKRKPMMKWTEAGRKFLLERYKGDSSTFNNLPIKKQA